MGMVLLFSGMVPVVCQQNICPPHGVCVCACVRACVRARARAHDLFGEVTTDMTTTKVKYTYRFLKVF